MLIKILPKLQLLELIKDDIVVKKYVISTAKNGLGEKQGSEKTPRGWHEIAEKIGDGMPLNAIFVSRKYTGEIYSAEQNKIHDRDWILTRILWLSGLEPGKNLGGDLDSKQRYIYIHGAPDCSPFGTPASKGCVRMRCNDLLTLYDLVEIGTKVYIADSMEG